MAQLFILSMVLLRTQSAWVVSPAEKAQFDELFKRADADGDGLVLGMLQLFAISASNLIPRFDRR